MGDIGEWVWSAYRKRFVSRVEALEEEPVFARIVGADPRDAGWDLPTARIQVLLAERYGHVDIELYCREQLFLAEERAREQQVDATRNVRVRMRIDHIPKMTVRTYT
jgi:hypothetical protein